MGLVKNLLVGRPDGLRSKLRAALSGGRSTKTDAPAAASSRSPAPVAPKIEPAEKALGLRKEPPRDVTPPDGYEVVLHKDALDSGRIIEIIIGGTAIAVANVDGTYYAISNACAHADGPLGEGSLAGCVVTCPYHGWRFDLRDGSCQTNPGAKVATYPVQVVGDAVCVRL
jgi:nitrite reductase/ring-hydroxylating ferredoxin subunit